MSTRLWKFLGDVVSFDTVDGAADAADAVLGLAEALNTDPAPAPRTLAPLVPELNSLLDGLNAPLGKLLESTWPFTAIGTGLLRFYRQVAEKEPTLPEAVALIAQAAYLESFREIAAKKSTLKKRLISQDNNPRAKAMTPQVKSLGEFELTDKAARFAMVHFQRSTLAAAFNEALAARMVQLGALPESAHQLADMVAQNAVPHIQATSAEAGDFVKRMVEWYRAGGDAMFEQYLSIDAYLEEQIAPRPDETVLHESFTFKQLYTPLKAKPLTAAGVVDDNCEPVVLEQWAQRLLHDDAPKDQVMVVQGKPGCGKSLFCCMFADWVRRYEHPRWTPILIRLRELSTYPETFEELLAKAIDRDFAKLDSDWLIDRNVNYLFLLDGVDELPMAGRTSRGVDDFLAQVGRFQAQCAQTPDKGHRVLITGQTSALQAIASRKPNNLERVEILPMAEDLQLHWFERWGNVIGETAPHLEEILWDLPEQMQELSQEPLLLYLLAAMHRDGELPLEVFEGVENPHLKMLIYRCALNWLLKKKGALNSLSDAQRQLSRTDSDEISDRKVSPEQWRRILQAVGLAIMQSGMEFTSIRAIADQFPQNDAVVSFLEAVQRCLDSDHRPLRYALVRFYPQSGWRGEGAIEFVHKSFGEFLCAEHIVNSLIDICQPGRNREYDMDDLDVCWTLYDLLGCHLLTPTIVNHLTALLLTHPEFQAEGLYKRLYTFYWRWSEGEFMDASPETLPQKKMRLLRARTFQQKRPLGQRQVDICAGLNVMIVLWELHRYGIVLTESQEEDGFEALQNPLAFHPCRSPSGEEFDDQRLRNIIGMSQCLGACAFGDWVGPFMNSADLSEADLSNVSLNYGNLSKVNLSHTNLSGSSLNHANLSGAILFSTNLSRADLFQANLSQAYFFNATLFSTYLGRADLSSSNLGGASLGFAHISCTNLSHADLSNASLSYAYLSAADVAGANLYGADLTDAILSGEYGAVVWDDQTRWEEVKGLDVAIGVPDPLKQELGLTAWECP